MASATIEKNSVKQNSNVARVMGVACVIVCAMCRLDSKDCDDPSMSYIILEIQAKNWIQFEPR